MAEATGTGVWSSRPRLWAATRWISIMTHAAWAITLGTAVGYDIEAIVGGAAVIVPMASAAALTGWFSRLWLASVYGLMTSTSCVMVFLWIWLGRVTPEGAQIPVSAFGAIYLVAALPLVVIIWRCRRERLDPTLCSACGYPLLHLSGDRCPECGEPFDPEVVAGHSSG